MTEPVGFFNFSLKKILKDESAVLENARIELLYYGLLLSAFVLTIISVSVIYQDAFIITITNSLLLVTMLVLFKTLTYWPNWRLLSHVLMVVATIVNLWDIFITIQDVNVVTVEVSILIVLFSFYMLGQRIGLMYSLANLLPMLLFFVLQYTNGYSLHFKPENVSGTTTIISIVATFLLIIFIQAHFYRAFLKNIKQLNVKGEEQEALNRKYEVAIAKAEKSSEAKTEFLSTMSHEIRTPLNAVIGMSDLLMMHSPRPDQTENLEVLKSSANNLLSIVNNVLDFNKIEAGKLIFDKTRFNLYELMNNICGGQIIVAQQKGLNFDLAIDDIFEKKGLLGDTTRLTQVIFNLVSNAIKFTREGSVKIKVSCLEDHCNKVLVGFSITDTGIGIDNNKLQAIFDPFVQESISTTRQYGGTGLGLAIVKRLLGLQGSKIQVQSKLNKGSEFSFSMEFEVATEKEPEQFAGNSVVKDIITGNATGSIKVLIAEDNAVNVVLMKKLLARFDIVPMIAENGARAVEMVTYGNFDIILMDLQMPVMNGFDATKQIRKMTDSAKANLPIIALTASALFDVREKIYDSGMNDYVAKPFKPTELIEKIHALVNATVS